MSVIPAMRQGRICILRFTRAQRSIWEQVVSAELCRTVVTLIRLTMLLFKYMRRPSLLVYGVVSAQELPEVGETISEIQFPQSEEEVRGILDGIFDFLRVNLDAAGPFLRQVGAFIAWLFEVIAALIRTALTKV